MREAFARIGVAFERIAGVDGATLGPELIEDFRRNRTEAKPDGWRPGEIGCFYGHFSAWQRVAAGEEPWAAVFEDDVHVAADLSPLLRSSDWIPAGAEIVRLEANRSMRLSSGCAITVAPNRRVFRALSGTPGAAGYILAKSVAKWLTEVPPRLHSIPDVFLFKPKISRVAKKLRRYQVVPAVCIQDEVLNHQKARLRSQIKTRNTRGRRYREYSSPLLALWPLNRRAVPFVP